jgi:hypothetical protein
MTRFAIAVFTFISLAGSALAQPAPGGARFCHQYASIIAGIAGDAIRRNPSCQDFSKGVHANYQMHYSWCMRTPRPEVEGADNHIRQLINRCAPPRRSGPPPQQGPGGARFCQQYASSTADVAAEAIRRNPSCQDFSKGVHGNYQMHYTWCMRTPRPEVEGAADHIRQLANRCAPPRRNPVNSGANRGGPPPQQGPGGARFCQQYASSTADVAAEAIRQNPSCQDFSKGVHANYQMHYTWCMRTPRAEVEGAADHIRQLANRCAPPRRGPGNSGANRGGPPPQQGAGPFGRVWHESEAGWQGTWIRIGNSNAFKATWTHPTAGVVRADLTINIMGNRVAVIRRDTFGPAVGKGCRYKGTMQGNVVSGQYDCDWARGFHPWSARIN